MTEPLACEGTAPLAAKTEEWMDALVRNPQECDQLLRKYGSPVNVHDFGPLSRNISELTQVAAHHKVDFKVYFARKANKTFAAALAAHNAGAGVDVASYRELRQCLTLNIPASDIIFTAATKTQEAVDLAISSNVVISVDNHDELQLIATRAKALSTEAAIALRIAVTHASIAPTRFGLPAEVWLELARNITSQDGIRIRGLHFHLNGYSAQERVIALRQTLALSDQLKQLGHVMEFVDIGGGIPMNYLKSHEQWQAFWHAVAKQQAGMAPGRAGDAADQAGSLNPAHLGFGSGSGSGFGSASGSGSGSGEFTREDLALNDSEGVGDQSTLATSCWGGPPVTPLTGTPSPSIPLPNVLSSATPLPDALSSNGVSLTAIANGGSESSTDPQLAPATLPLTWCNDALGLKDPTLDRPSPATYPYFQNLTRGEWLDQILASPYEEEDPERGGETIAQALIDRSLQLRCEPGRSLMDGCGMTLARVAFTKTTSDHIPLVGLHMNRTQVRSTSADFLVDPILVRPGMLAAPTFAEAQASPLSGTHAATHPETSKAVSGAFLVGSYCIEDELILRRSFNFPQGVRQSDVLAFPNTAGYLMHILESASHQIPLAANVVHEHAELPEPGDSPEVEVPCAQWTRDLGDNWVG